MIEIKQEINIAIVDKIKEHFVEDGGYTKEVIAAELRRYMTETPDSVFVLVGYDGEEIVGHTIAWLPENRGYIWSDQSWIKNGTPTEYVKMALALMETWAKIKGVNEIRLETERNKDAIVRRWGFQEHGVIMTKRLSNDTGN